MISLSSLISTVIIIIYNGMFLYNIRTNELKIQLIDIARDFPCHSAVALNTNNLYYAETIIVDQRKI